MHVIYIISQKLQSQEWMWGYVQKTSASQWKNEYYGLLSLLKITCKCYQLSFWVFFYLPFGHFHTLIQTYMTLYNCHCNPFKKSCTAFSSTYIPISYLRSQNLWLTFRTQLISSFYPGHGWRTLLVLSKYVLEYFTNNKWQN